ncbi:MAG TPA: type I-C CRISPR-associated protein Cas7/Csd2 [Spirochaetota bacterium]|nr:type I-C CRISPR-associated protein Cas7/Csd2 [Spirochaetota bacterium]
MNKIDKRHDFVIFFDVKDGNPNGDPDAGNLPRIDAETGMGLVTDVCLKRKIRNYVQLTQYDEAKKDMKDGFGIYIKEKAVLGRAHVKAFNELGISLGEESRKEINADLLEKIQDYPLPDGLTVEEDENEKSWLVVASDADIKEIQEYLKENEPASDVKKFLNESIKGVKSRKPKADEVERGRDWMCKAFYDIRTFGAVLSLKSAPNCGQVRGPVQLTFARSVEPIVSLEHSITRMAVATEAESIKQSGDNRTMGRKFTVPYGLYRAHGFISAHLAEQTKFNSDDLKLFWNALQEMFDHDHSAARGLMSTRQIVVFEHETALGNKPAHELFDRITWKRTTEGPARDYSDYEILLDGKKITNRFEEIKVS